MGMRIQSESVCPDCNGTGKKIEHVCHKCKGQGYLNKKVEVEWIYSEMLEKIDINEAIEAKFGNVDIEKVLDEMDKEIANKNVKYLTHKEVFGELRRKLNEK